MRQVVALAWKEWREVRWVLLVALVAFVALPAVGGLENLLQYRRFVFATSGWIAWAGGILATLVGAFSATRDLRGNLSEFWRSRAVGVTGWLVVKFLVGLATVLAACLIPLVIEAWADRANPHSEHAAALFTAWCPFVWAAQFAFGFCCGCLTRRTGPAVMLALALSLLAYVLPLLFPPLSRLNLAEVLTASQPIPSGDAQGSHPPVSHVPWVPWDVPFVASRQMPFVIEAVGISLFAFLLGVFAVRRGWRVRAGQGLMYWSVAVAALLLFGSAAFQLSSNLPTLQVVELPPGEVVMSIHTDGHRGMLVTTLNIAHMFEEDPLSLRSIAIDGDGVRLGPRIEIAGASPRLVRDRWAQAWLPRHPDLCFALARSRAPGAHQPFRVQLVALPLNGASRHDVPPLDLGTAFDPDDPALPIAATRIEQGVSGELFGAGDRLFASWWRWPIDRGCAVIDVTDPRHPRLSSEAPWRPGAYTPDDQFTTVRNLRYVLALPPLPGASFKERISAALDAFGEANAGLQGDVMAIGWPSLRTLRLTSWSDAPFTLHYRDERPDGPQTRPATETTPDADEPPPPVREIEPVQMPGGYAEFRMAGRYEPTFLESFLGGTGNQITGGNQFIYVSSQTSAFGRDMPRIIVFDVSDPARPRVVGHFAVPGEVRLYVRPLPDGRALIGGRKLYVVGPPPSARGR